MSLYTAWAKPKRNKYHAVATVVDGIRFDSKAEAMRWQELKLLERAGEIMGLERQVNFSLSVRDQLICSYRADFTFWKRVDRGWDYTVEDCKGVRTREYQIKKKLMKACHYIEIQEVG